MLRKRGLKLNIAAHDKRERLVELVNALLEGDVAVVVDVGALDHELRDGRVGYDVEARRDELGRHGGGVRGDAAAHKCVADRGGDDVAESDEGDEDELVDEPDGDARGRNGGVQQKVALVAAPQRRDVCQREDGAGQRAHISVQLCDSKETGKLR